MAAVRGSDVLEASQVRVLSAEGEVVGAGFLVAADVMCTCAHVVTQALGVPDSVQAAPGELVDIDLPLLEGRPRVRAAVVSWRSRGQDVALLRLEAAIEGARPVQLVDGTGVWGHTFRALGYPGGADLGVWASGTLRAGQGSGWVQMEAHEPGPRISGGFSGSPVWDDAQNGVVGMTVAAHVGERTAYLLPSAELVDEETLRSRCPFQGLAPFSEVHAEFFHGRDDDITRVHSAVRRRPLTLVTGPSGCGKSSLVGAGVLPRLRSGGMGVTELRPVPGVRAAAVLARALTGVLEPGLGEIERLTKAEELTGLLDADGSVPAELRSRILARGGGSGHVLFVDQFEEYAAAEAASARALLQLLAALAGDEGPSVLRVVATVRPDSLDALVTAETSDLVSEAVAFLAPLAAEGLEQAVTGPVRDVPGLWFEPGLPERIISDAGDEPGRMTLVQFALTKLWERRTRSMLTHAAYDELGGVAGALVVHADDTLDRLTPSRRELARRLFVQLARPDGDVFFRRPTRAVDLTPELMDLAKELAPSKLVVLSRGPGDSEEVVDLAHEALTRLWPRLQRWLADSRDFRAWQEQLRADLRRWQAQQRESPRLLSGTDLAEADRRLAEHPDDISADERGYVLLSLRHSRRRGRVKQAAVAALSVLTALALVLAGVTVRSLRDTQEQLRIQAAALLAQAAEDTPDNSPATALQLALAAWSTQQTPKTRDALMHQYVRGQYLVGAHPSVWRGRALTMDAAPDGRTLVVRSNPSGGSVPTFTVVTGALEGTPKAWELGGVPADVDATDLSPDGSLFVAASEDKVRLWKLTDGAGHDPIVLNRGEHKLAQKNTMSLDFSGDGKRVLLAVKDNSMECYYHSEVCVPPFAEAWEVPSGNRIPVADSLLTDNRLAEVAFTTDSNLVALVTYLKDEAREVIVKDLTTGRQLYGLGPQPKSTLYAQLLRAGGVALTWVDGRPYVRTLGRTPGPLVAVPDNGSFSTVDATGNYGVEGHTGIGDVSEGGYVESTLTDGRTGQLYHTRIPTVGEMTTDRTGIAVVPQTDGTLVALVPVGTSLMEVRAERTGAEMFQGGDSTDGRFALSPDGRFVAKVADKTLEVLDASRTVLRSVAIPAAEGNLDWQATWTADSQSVVVWGRKAGLQRAYQASDLRQSVPLPQEVQKGQRVDSVAGVQGREIVLLTENGTLARLDAGRGTILTQPFLAHPGPNNNRGLLGDAFINAQIVARPGHPDQVAVVTKAGGNRGEILLWDFRAPEQVVEPLVGPAINSPYTERSLGSSLVFSSDGSWLAVENSDGRVRIWDVDRRERLPIEVPRPTLSHLIGFTPDGRLLTYLSGIVKIYDLTNGSFVTLSAAEPTEEITDGTAQVTWDYQLVIDNAGGRRTFDLRPEVQFRTLCVGAGRDYTQDERKLLPKGTPSEPPCS